MDQSPAVPPSTDAPRHELVVDIGRFEEQLPQLRQAYQAAIPYPHIVIDDFLPAVIARQAIDEFPPLDPQRWNNYIHANERKFSHTDPTTWGPTLQAILTQLNSPRFVNLVSALCGFEGLFPDPSLEGGGLHQSTTGGFLNIHADFTVHPHHRTWERRANLLLYLNDEWKPEYGGDLELWSPDMQRCEGTIAPVANRLVIFTTSADSFHGHPTPMRCPPGTARRSLALYYFTEEEHPVARSTEYRARPGDGMHSLVIYADKQTLRAYDWAKRRLGVSDQAASAVMRRLGRFARRRQR